MTEQTSSQDQMTASAAVDATAAWISVVRAYNECQTTMAAAIAPLGITLLEHEILINLLRTPGLTQKQLAERCFSAKSGISMLVTKMIKRGLVERKNKPDDQRAWLIFLTRHGATLAAQAHQAQEKIVADMTKPYSEDELAMIKALMDASSARLRDLRSATGSL